MIKNAQITARTGVTVVWEGDNLNEIMEVAGDAFTGVQVGLVVIRNPPGESDNYTYIQQGWSLSRFDGNLMVSGEKVRTWLIADLPEG